MITGDAYGRPHIGATVIGQVLAERAVGQPDLTSDTDIKLGDLVFSGGWRLHGFDGGQLHSDRKKTIRRSGARRPEQPPPDRLRLRQSHPPLFQNTKPLVLGGWKRPYAASPLRLWSDSVRRSILMRRAPIFWPMAWRSGGSGIARRLATGGALKHCGAQSRRRLLKAICNCHHMKNGRG